MIIVVKKLGDSNKFITLDVEAADRIEDVKEMIACREGITPDEQRLIFCGKVLSDGNTLYDYSITTNATIYLQVRRVKFDECLTNCSVQNADIPVGDNVVEHLKAIHPCFHSMHSINAAY
jgi:ubiquitin